MFEIIYQREGGVSKRFVCENAACTIGRGAGNDLVLDDKVVSRSHARLKRGPQGILIEDLGSMSGTWVNQERVVSYGPLSDVDEIVIGAYRLLVRDRTAAGVAVKSPARHAAAQAPAAVTPTSPPGPAASPLPPAPVEKPPSAELYRWRQFVHAELLATLDLRRKDVHSMSDEVLRTETEALIREIIKKHDDKIPRHIEREALLSDVLDEAVGLGPLEKLLADEAVTEVMVNRYNEIFIERAGKLQKSPLTFTSDRAVLGVIERIISPLGRRIDESSPMVDARLKDGSRVNAVIPPLAIKGPCITIRKFAKRRLTTEDLVGYGSLSPQMVEFLRICVVHRRNVVVSGGTGSGKTTLLNVLSNFIPQDERIVTVEDAAELKLCQPNLVSLEARPPNLEGRGAITIRDLVRNALRMRPDRIVVGECRGGEALDMLQAMNTGHDGSLTTLHANSPRDALSRLEVMVLMAGMELPVSAIREQIASAVNLIIQQTRFSDGSRKVTHISEVTGIESGKIQLQNIFVFNQQGFDADGKIVGRFEACGFVPAFYEELARIGVPVDLGIFRKPGEEV